MLARTTLIGLMISALASGAALAQAPLGVARLVHADGTAAGTVRILARKGGAVIDVRATGISAGVHGIHLHAVGKCEGPAFTTAGGHLNPQGHQHGTLNPAGSHMGDLPNVTAEAKGRVNARVPLSIAPAALLSALFDADGAAIVIHAGPDDYKSDPAGNSGGRIACGVLSRK